MFHQFLTMQKLTFQNICKVLSQGVYFSYKLYSVWAWTEYKISALKKYILFTGVKGVILLNQKQLRDLLTGAAIILFRRLNFKFYNEENLG